MENKSMHNSWLEVEMNETVDLLRKKLEKMNDIEPCHLDHQDIQCLKNIYKTLYYVFSIEKSMS